MENEEAFDAEARRDSTPTTKRNPTPTTRAPPSYQSQDTGHDATTAIAGVNGHKDSDYEETPLLSRDHSGEDYSGRTSSNGDDDAPSPAQWSGAKEFEGLPWWKKPSVSQATNAPTVNPKY